MRRVSVELSTDPTGTLYVTPNDGDVQELLADHMFDMNGHRDQYATVEEWKVDDFLAEHANEEDADNVRRGYKVDIEMDAWVLGHYYGCDAETVFE